MGRSGVALASGDFIRALAETDRLLAIDFLKANGKFARKYAKCKIVRLTFEGYGRVSCTRQVFDSPEMQGFNFSLVKPQRTVH